MWDDHAEEISQCSWSLREVHLQSARPLVEGFTWIPTDGIENSNRCTIGPAKTPLRKLFHQNGSTWMVPFLTVKTSGLVQQMIPGSTMETLELPSMRVFHRLMHTNLGQTAGYANSDIAPDSQRKSCSLLAQSHKHIQIWHAFFMSKTI